jgi:hypothetical protein
MAKKKNWWSGVIATQILWWINFISSLGTYQTELEVDGPELTAKTNDSAMFQYVFAQEKEALAYLDRLMVYRKALIKGPTGTLIGLPPEMVVLTPPVEVEGGMMDRTFDYVKTLRQRDGFTTTIEEALKVVGDDIPAFNGSTFIARGKGKTTFDGNLLGFVKGPWLEGVGVFRMRGEETEYSLLKDITKGEYLDDELNLVAGPETRKYIVRGFINNKYVGSPCPPISLTWTSPAPPPPPLSGAEGEALKAEPKA